MMRSRQPRSDNDVGGGGFLPPIVVPVVVVPLQNNNNDYGGETTNKGNKKHILERHRAQIFIIVTLIISCCILIGARANTVVNNANNNNLAKMSSSSSSSSLSSLSSVAHHHQGGTNDAMMMNGGGGPIRLVLPPAKVAPMGRIIYGAKSKGEDTSRLVKEAIQSGFRHIATGGFHNEYNEAGVGVGWKESGIPRNELYLQTLFLSRSTNGYGTQNCLIEDDEDMMCPPPPDLDIEYQVHLSIRSSLQNLQTRYIDAVLVHNFRAKLQPYDETLRAWRVLEGYVDRGVVRHLGIVSAHDGDYLQKLHGDARIKPAIIQNRFHSNRGYDIDLRPLLRELDGIVARQLFWILTGSAGSRVRNNDVVRDIAERKGVSPQVLLYSFTMELGGSPLIGTKSAAHMKEDADALLVADNSGLVWENGDLAAMAGVINKNLVQ